MALFQTNTVWVQQLADDVAAVVLDVPGPTSTLDPETLTDLEKAIDAIDAETRFRLLVLRSNHATGFCTGTDPLTWAKLATTQTLARFVDQGQRLCGRLTGLRMPTVAVIDGPCLGSGLELALACDYRLVTEHPSTVLGFNENELGLVPSFGGVGRVLRLVGLENSLQMLLGGKRLSAREAIRWGLVNDYLDESSEQAPTYLRDAVKADASTLRRRTWRQKLVESTAFGRGMILRGAERVLRRRLPDDMPAPAEALAVISTDLQHGFNPGLAAAKDAALRLSDSDAFKNLSRLHELKRRGPTDSTTLHPPQRLGVVGGSSLGLQLVLQSVARGRPVVLRESDEMTLGLTVLHLIRVLQQDVTNRTITQDAYTQQANNIRGTAAWKHFDELDLIVDASAGNLESKRKLLRTLETQVAPTALVALTEPNMTIGAVQEGAKHPERVVGLRWPAPSSRSGVFEISAGDSTRADIVPRLQRWLGVLGKTGVLVRDVPGGVVQRVWFPAYYEAILLIQEGVLPERIEDAMRRFGMVHGLLDQLDAIHLDDFVRLANSMQATWPNQVADAPLVQTMLTRRWLGVKTGIGFYRYGGGQKKLNAGLKKLVVQRDFDVQSAADQVAQVQRRLVGLMVNEAMRSVEGGIVASADDVDLAMMLTGWAPHRGGPLRYAETVGAKTIAGWLAESASLGERFAPCSLLLARAASTKPTEKL